MATNADTLKGLILQEFENCGWDINAATQVDCLAQAIAEAVVQHIKDAAKANVTYGSSSGLHNVI